MSTSAVAAITQAVSPVSIGAGAAAAASSAKAAEAIRNGTTAPAASAAVLRALPKSHLGLMLDVTRFSSFTKRAAGSARRICRSRGSNPCAKEGRAARPEKPKCGDLCPHSVHALLKFEALPRGRAEVAGPQAGARGWAGARATPRRLRTLRDVAERLLGRT